MILIIIKTIIIIIIALCSLLYHYVNLVLLLLRIVYEHVTCIVLRIPFLLFMITLKNILLITNVTVYLNIIFYSLPVTYVVV